MQRNEPQPSRRRIPIQIENSANVPVTGANLDGKISLSLSGAAPTSQGGTWEEIGEGTYIYEATQAETDTDLFLMVMVTDASWRPFVLPIWIDDGLVVGQTVDAKRRMPLWIEDSNGVGVPGLVITGSELQLSLDGSVFTNGLGVVNEIGLGAYYYQATLVEMVEGTAILRVLDSGGSPPLTVAYDIITPDTGDTTPPTVTVISPTPGIAPGDPGGFPADRAAADLTPIVLLLSDAAPGIEYICVVAEYPTGPEIIFRRGRFFEPYMASTYLAAGPDVTMTVIRESGWPRRPDPTLGSYIKFLVDALDYDGNIDGGIP